MAAKLDFNVEQIDPITMTGNEVVCQRDMMSPYVWRLDNGLYAMLVRAVPRPGESGDTGTIWYATSTDGLRFTATDAPVLSPGPGPDDIGGCEDPTPVFRPDGSVVIYYTGVDETRSHGEMLYAVGPSIDRLEKMGVAMPNTPSQGNIKEATVDRTKNGGWRMFFEYAHHEASRVGLAVSDDIAGPWTDEHDPFAPRSDSWDNWHLSTGPLLTIDKDMPVMFYNGATHDARWRIGWVAFDAEYTQVVARGVEPLITPPPEADRTATDIAFAASVVVVDDQIWLYYSLWDTHLYRAIIRRST
ncbi:glycosidase-like protein [Novosphingobium sp. Rr 2-17]|uniref:glycoside hydrolase family 130 protein n=1 Tax=Novosphingobium sp. Rr 2-17 TaxID=555793 RepID=UPI0002698B5C|nr:glycosidase [Novosphingobium sp. Rr 2-17]EIZ80560.1 glycosidase-like protein [Novosphingobium sp. Rr 2-17]